MRIRSIRPEFWSSEDIASLSWEHRLIYIGLWSYVDDNGVGRDNAKLIAADLFPLEDVPPVMSIHGALSEYSKRGMITRYTVDGKPYLHVSEFLTHQKINRPSDGRYPLPTSPNAVIHGALTEGSVRAQPEMPLGEGEKGRRGEGETATRDDENRPADETTQTLIAEWIQHCGGRPPARVVGHVAKEIRQMLSEGIPYDEVRRGLASWQGKGLHPSALASEVHACRTPRTPRPSPGTHDFSAAMARAAARDAQKELSA